MFTRFDSENAKACFPMLTNFWRLQAPSIHAYKVSGVTCFIIYTLNLIIWFHFHMVPITSTKGQMALAHFGGLLAPPIQRTKFLVWPILYSTHLTWSFDTIFKWYLSHLPRVRWTWPILGASGTPHPADEISVVTCFVLYTLNPISGHHFHMVPRTSTLG